MPAWSDPRICLSEMTRGEGQDILPNAQYHMQRTCGNEGAVSRGPPCCSLDTDRLSIGDTDSFWGRYELQGQIGRGKFGEVRQCVDRVTGEVLACKVVEGLDDVSAQKMEAEVEAMCHLVGHGNVVALREAFWENDKAFIVMELCQAGDLFDVIASSDGGLDEASAKGLFRQISCAVQQCHRNGFLHRDIKPENIFLANATSPGSSKRHVTAKLGDFGLAQRISETGGFTCGRAGSNPYSAPEVEQGLEYSYPADVWSLGVLLCAMLTADWPEFDDTGAVVSLVPREYEQCISVEALELMQRMLRVNPLERPTIKDVLCHPWLQSRH